MTVFELFALVMRRWKVIVGSVVIALLAAVALSIVMPPQYESTARMFVASDNGTKRDPYALSLLAGQRVKSYAELATSRQVLSAVAKRTQARDDVAGLRDQVDAEVLPETFVIALSAQDETAKEAQALARIASVEAAQYLSSLEGKGTTRSGLEVTITDPASVPESPVAPRIILYLIIAGLLGLLVGLALAVLVDRRDNSDRLDDDEDEADGDEHDLTLDETSVDRAYADEDASDDSDQQVRDGAVPAGS